MRKSRTKKPNERGAILLLTAGSMLVLFIFVGFGVDLGIWYVRGQVIQKAADAASLAAVVHLPNEIDAKTACREVAKKNGFEDGVNGITVECNQVKDDPQNLSYKADITDNAVPAFFTAFINSHNSIHRASTSDFDPKLHLGNNGTFGRPDPYDTSAPVDDQYWALAVGPYTNRGAGAIYGTDCFPANMVSGHDACSNPHGNTHGGGDLLNGSGANDADYKPGGELYAIDVPAHTHGTMTVDIFDPAFVEDTTCDNTTVANTADKCKAIDSTAPFLRHDRSLADNDNSAYSFGVTTQYIMYNNDGSQYTIDGHTPLTTQCHAGSNGGPGNQIFDPWVRGGAPRIKDNGVVDPAQTLSQLNPYSAPGVVDNKQKKFITATDPGDGHTASKDNVYRNWWTLCSVNVPNKKIPTTYYIRVKTSQFVQDDGVSPDPTRTTDYGNGHNSFAVKATISTSATPMSVSAVDYASASFNASNGAIFDLAQVPSYAHGKQLNLSMWDFGDGNGVDTRYVQVLKPDGSPADATCGISERAANPDGTGGQVTVPIPQGSIALNCNILTANGATKVYNDHWNDVTIQIPDSYTCDPATPPGCYWKIKYSISPLDPTDNAPDQVTWEASLHESPVRIVK